MTTWPQDIHSDENRWEALGGVQDQQVQGLNDGDYYNIKKLTNDKAYPDEKHTIHHLLLQTSMNLKLFLNLNAARTITVITWMGSLCNFLSVINMSWKSSVILTQWYQLQSRYSDI